MRIVSRSQTRRRSAQTNRRPFFDKSRGIKGQSPIEALEKRRLLSANITQFHYDPSSTGQDLSETVLTPTNVNATDFGREFITQLDGQVYAQPLAVQSINITRVGSNSTETTGVHNVLYVATMHDSLFAVDADTGAILWQDSFLQINGPEVTTNLSLVPTAGVIPFPLGTVTGTENAGINSNDVAPEEGVFGTPVIDPKTNILYCISYTQERRTDTSNSATPSATGTDWHFVERLWAINLADGSVAITPTRPAGAPVPAAMGQTIADTCLNYTGSSFPSFSSFTGYEYFAGPYVKGSGDNGDSADTHNSDTDGWIVNPNDLTSNNSHSVFAGTTPYAQGDLALNAIIQPTRTGLMLLNGTIYFGMTSHGDDGPYYGWVLGYSASTLQNTAAFVTTPTWENYDIISGSAGSSSSTYDSEGAIWGGEQSITTDGTYLYMSLGNGAFDWTSTNFPTGGTNTTTDAGNTVQLPLDGDYGNATLKLAIDPNANQGGLSITSLPTTFNPDGSTPGVNGQNVNGYGIKVTDFFVASNMIYLNYKDLDVGSGGVLLLPSNVTSTVPGHVGDPMLVTGGKEGRVYLIDRDDMGGFDTSYFSNNVTDSSATYANGTAVFSSPGNGVPNQGPDPISYDRVLGEYEGLGSFFTIPSFYMNGSVPTLVIDGNGQGVKTFNLNTFQYTTSSLPANDNNNPVPLGTSSATFANHGSTSAISANNSSNAIVWNIDAQKSTSADDLLAFNMSMTNLYTSGSGVLTDSITNDTATKFSVPSVFNGMVYVGIGAGWGSSGSTQTAWAQGAIVGFGLLDSYLTSNASYFGAPTALAGQYVANSGVQLTWTRNSTLETETEIDRSPNGTAWTVLAYLSNGASAYTDTTALGNTSYEYRVRVISGANASAAATTTVSAANPSWLQSGSVASWNSATQVLTVTGSTTIIADPGIDEPIVEASGSAASLTINPSSGTDIHLGGLSLTDGAYATVTSLGSARSTSNFRLLVIGTPGSTAAPTYAIDSTSTLNLADNDMAILYGTGSSPLPAVTSELSQAYDNKLWDKPGLTSTIAKALGGVTSLGFGEASTLGLTSFDGAALGGNAVLVKYTLTGDANLDGSVNLSDYNTVVANFNATGQTWTGGSFTYTGTVSLADYNSVISNFNQTLADVLPGGSSSAVAKLVTTPAGGTVVTPPIQTGRRPKRFVATVPPPTGPTTSPSKAKTATVVPPFLEGSNGRLHSFAASNPSAPIA